MSDIQWFPGHMQRAQRQIADCLAEVDVTLELHDARLPRGSANPLFPVLRARRQRPVLHVLTKADLADARCTAAWLACLKQQGEAALALDQHRLAVSSHSHGRGAAQHPLFAALAALVPHRQGGVKPIRALILGIPNVGKSTLINRMARHAYAPVADTPGLTRTLQRIELLDGTILVDSPGLLWPKLGAPARSSAREKNQQAGSGGISDHRGQRFTDGKRNGKAAHSHRGRDAHTQEDAGDEENAAAEHAPLRSINEQGLKLALCNTIGVRAYDAEETARYALAWLWYYAPQGLEKRYRLSLPAALACGAASHETVEAAVEVIWQQIAQTLGCLRKGGGGRIHLDAQKTASRILSDFRDGRLGRLSLEHPDDSRTLYTPGFTENQTPADA